MARESEKASSEISRLFSRFLPAALPRLLGRATAAELEPGDFVEAVITIMFVDLRNFSALSETLRPEEVVGLLNAWFGRIEPLVRARGGFVDKYIGDAAMAVFTGQADEALRCALEISRALEALNAERIRDSLPPLKVGIGLNTGIAALAAIGGPGRLEVTVVGDAVNIAARMESSSKTYGVGILASEHTVTWLRERESFRLRFLDRVLVRGKKVPLSVYEALDADPEPLGSRKADFLPEFDRAVAYYHYGKVAEAKALFGRVLELCPEDAPCAYYLERCRRFESSGQLDCAVEMKLYPVWDEGFAVGHALIDAQHRRLFESVALLMRMIDEDNFDGVGAVVRFLDHYVVTHFQAEEGLMRSCDYPLYADHKAQHDRFALVFRGLVGELGDFADHGVYIAFRMRILVVDWLLNHTSKIDPHLAQYLSRKACSGIY